MENKNCSLEAKCLRVLGGYPKDIPQRCEECTDLVKFTIEITPDWVCTEEDLWNG